MDPATLLILAVGLASLLVGAAIGWLLASRPKAVYEERARLLAGQLQQLQVTQAENEGVARERVRALGETLEERAARISQLEAELDAAAISRTENDARVNAVIADTKQQFTDAFQALASKILDEKTAKFTATNETKLNELLNPLRERLKDFQKKIEDTHVTETAERRSLKDELKRLMDLNQQVSQDTKNLTTALKGEAKTQGNWGEFILERVLEMSGLKKGIHFDVQDSQRAADGSLQQPDVVIRLPDSRNLVVDSKVSLVAFERYSSATTDEERAAALAGHLQSLRAHIRSLGDKNYPALYGIKSPDFVLMFIPMEAAFMAAVQADSQLYKTGWERNVVLVSTTTLLATARVVNSVWQLENQNRNVMKIADQAGKMHDAFVLFAQELEKSVKQVQGAAVSVESALNRLHTGRGNLVRRADEIRKLGAKTSKQLPANLLESADDGALEPEDTASDDADAGPA